MLDIKLKLKFKKRDHFKDFGFHRTKLYKKCFRFQEKNSNMDQNSNLGPPISSLVLYHLSYLGSIDGTGLNLSPESNATEGIVVCDSHHLSGELTSSVFILMF